MHCAHGQTSMLLRHHTPWAFSCGPGCNKAHVCLRLGVCLVRLLLLAVPRVLPRAHTAAGHHCGRWCHPPHPQEPDLQAGQEGGHDPDGVGCCCWRADGLAPTTVVQRPNGNLRLYSSLWQHADRCTMLWHCFFLCTAKTAICFLVRFLLNPNPQSPCVALHASSCLPARCC